MVKLKKGFTLIELLIVMAILGVLAVVVLVAINPVQQLARTRDTGRKSAVNQIGRTLQAYFTGRNGKYLMTTTPNCTLATGWVTCLVAVGELKSVPSEIVAIDGSDCYGGTYPTNHGQEEGWCYSADNAGGAAVVYARLESKAESSKCDNIGYIPYIIWSSAAGKSCLRCFDPTTGTRPNPGDTQCNSKQ